MNYFVLECRVDARIVKRANCRCGACYLALWDAECSNCPRCGRLNIHALLTGWRRQPKRS